MCWSGAARPAALAAYAAAPKACAPMWATAAACPAARAAAAAAGALTSRAAPPPTNRRRISSATSSSPRAKARVRAIASRGRRSSGASASNNHSTRSAQSAAHAATIRRSPSLSVCRERISNILATLTIRERSVDASTVPSTLLPSATRSREILVAARPFHAGRRRRKALGGRDCARLGALPTQGGVMPEVLLDAAGRPRSPATLPGFRAGRSPRNKGQRYPADPPTVAEIVAVMRHAGTGPYGSRLRALIVVLWRAGLRIHEALALAAAATLAAGSAWTTGPGSNC